MALAQTSPSQVFPPQEREVLRARQSLEEQQRALQPSDPTFASSKTSSHKIEPIEGEKPCFVINDIVIKASSSEEYSGLLPDIENFKGKCLGEKSLNALLGFAQNTLISQGWVTTRALAKPQNLRSGLFEISIEEGRAGRILPNEGTPANFPYLNALGIREGERINQRDLEQALETFKRLPTVDANFQLRPGEKEGTSNIVIDWKQKKIWRVTAQIDDSGSKESGKMLGTIAGYLENALHLNDLFSLSFTRDLRLQHVQGVRGINAHFSVPYDRWTLALDAGMNRFRQTIIGYFQNYEYSGDVQTLNASLSRVLHRDSSSRTSIAFHLWGRASHNYVNDREIIVQRRRTSGFMFELKRKQYIGKSTFELALQANQAQKWWKALSAPEDQFGEGASRPRLYKAELIGVVPFSLASLEFTFENLTRGQWTDQPLVISDRFSIAGRSLVRGFDGEIMLAGERGFYSRNTLALNLGGLAPVAAGQNFYFGMDYGAINGKSTRFLTEKTITGAVFGLRGQIKALEYDVFASLPIDKPQVMKTPATVFGFMARASY